MSRVNVILDQFTDALSLVAPCSRGSLWLDQISEFPRLTYIVQQRDLAHIGDNDRFSAMTISLRGYVRGEDAQSLCDELIMNIESSLASWTLRSEEVEDVRVLEVSSDEGILSPLGVVEMTLRIIYQHSFIL